MQNEEIKYVQGHLFQFVFNQSEITTPSLKPSSNISKFDQRFNSIVHTSVVFVVVMRLVVSLDERGRERVKEAKKNKERPTVFDSLHYADDYVDRGGKAIEEGEGEE